MITLHLRDGTPIQIDDDIVDKYGTVVTVLVDGWTRCVSAQLERNTGMTMCIQHGLYSGTCCSFC